MLGPGKVFLESAWAWQSALGKCLDLEKCTGKVLGPAQVYLESAWSSSTTTTHEAPCKREFRHHVEFVTHFVNELMQHMSQQKQRVGELRRRASQLRQLLTVD